MVNNFQKNFLLNIKTALLGVYAADGKIEAGKKLPLTDVGASFYPNLVHLNHSCAPNTLRINKGHRVSYN